MKLSWLKPLNLPSKHTEKHTTHIFRHNHRIKFNTEWCHRWNSGIELTTVWKNISQFCYYKIWIFTSTSFLLSSYRPLVSKVTRHWISNERRMCIFLAALTVVSTSDGLPLFYCEALYSAKNSRFSIICIMYAATRFTNILGYDEVIWTFNVLTIHHFVPNFAIKCYHF